MHFIPSLLKGNVTINHVFAVHDSSPTMMLLKADDDSETLRVNFKKRGTGADAERVDNLQKFVLKQLKAAGVKDIKQVELYKKWRRFVPDPFKDIICPKPDDDVIKREDKATKSKRDNKGSSKKENEINIFNY